MVGKGGGKGGGKEVDVERNRMEWDDTKAMAGLYEYTPAIKIRGDTLKKLTAVADVNKKKMTVKVINKDTLAVAADLITKKYKPLVVVSCRSNMPNSGDSGSAKHEYEVVRRSNLLRCLDEFMFPLGVSDYLFSDGVTVFKDEEYEKVEPFKVAMLMCPVLVTPGVVFVQGNGGSRIVYKNLADGELMREKIFGIFQIARERGFDSVVVGAVGCGSSKNPIDVVIGFFNEALLEFDIGLVVFAILDSGGGGGVSGGEKIYKMFNSGIRR